MAISMATAFTEDMEMGLAMIIAMAIIMYIYGYP
jgi:hypothetical protein